MTEQWLPIPDCHPYEVSDLGNIRNTATGNTIKGTYVKPGYRRVHLKVDGKRIYKLIHVAVLEAFVGPRPNGMDGCHTNCIRDDNRLENLRWDTRRNNIADSVRLGLWSGMDRTRCPSGHPYDESNTSISIRNGRRHRRCRQCNADRCRARKLALKEAS